MASEHVLPTKRPIINLERVDSRQRTFISDDLSMLGADTLNKLCHSNRQATGRVHSIVRYTEPG